MGVLGGVVVSLVLRGGGKEIVRRESIWVIPQSRQEGKLEAMRWVAFRGGSVGEATQLETTRLLLRGKNTRCRQKREPSFSPKQKHRTFKQYCSHGRKRVNRTLFGGGRTEKKGKKSQQHWEED